VAFALARETVIDASGERRFKVKPSAIVVKYAVLGGAPDWELERTRLEVERHDNGRPKWFRLVMRWEGDVGGNPELGSWHDVEGDGFNAKARRPYPEAYRICRLEPDPTPAIQGRIEYELWRSALDWLVVETEGLTEVRLQASPRALRPWESAAGARAGHLGGVERRLRGGRDKSLTATAA
jgi:hypothetical protein